MGESACLMHTFSYASGISDENQQGNPVHALGDSISFGRFMSESLSWEKWSTFSHKRYVEEAERYAQPGSVAQKKAFFEAHYKSIAAKKAAAAALLEQANAANNNHPEPEIEGQARDVSTHDSQTTTIINCSQVPVDEQLEVKTPKTEAGSIVNRNDCNSNGEQEELEIGKVKVADSVTEQEVLVENPMKKEPLNQLEKVVNHTIVSEMELGESPQMEKPLLKGFKSSEEAPSPISKKEPEFPSSKPAVHRRAPKVPASPVKPAAPIHPRRENNVTPITRKSTIDYPDKKKSTAKSLHELIYSTPAREPEKPTTPAARRIESSRVAPSPYKASRDCKTPLRSPINASVNGVLKHPSATTCSESRRSRTPLHPSAAGSKTTGPKWHILSTVCCSKSLSACRNKLQSPTLSVPFSLRTEERAARRKQKPEEKFNAEEQKVQLQTRLKKKAETKLRSLSQSLCFKARPLPDFHKESETPKDQIKNVKTPLAHPQSPKLGRRKPSSSKLQGIITSVPPETASTKDGCPKNVLKKRSQIPNTLTSQPVMIAHENTSPNIQLW